MIVSILASSATFSGVTYNTDKVEAGKGELMLVNNFGALQGISSLRPEDYRSYLKQLAALNKRVSKPQFHAAISARGKSADKATLTALAVRWLEEMGYGRQPYLVIFHGDTSNNHVHMVSVRVDRNGKKINSGFEKIRAVKNLSKVLGTDYGMQAAQDVQNALEYWFSTKAQFMMILESQGYTVKEVGAVLEIIRYGEKQSEVSLVEVKRKIDAYQKQTERQKQLKAIFEKYSDVYDTRLSRGSITLPGGLQRQTNDYTSAFSCYLKEKMGIVLAFHAQGEKPPYGYTLIDHAQKAVWKGNEIMPLKDLFARSGINDFLKKEKIPGSPAGTPPEKQEKEYYAALLKAAAHNYPDLRQGLHHLDLEIIPLQDGKAGLADKRTGQTYAVEILLTGSDLAEFQQQYTWGNTDRAYVPPVSIAEDVDDEAINGRNRRRKRKARTNSR